jgi:Tfp pilus assembly protein PilF
VRSHPRTSELRVRLAMIQARGGDLNAARQTLEKILVDSNSQTSRVQVIRMLRDLENEIAVRAP